MCQNYDILNYCWVHKKNYDIISHKGILVAKKIPKELGGQNYLYFAHFWVQFEAVWYRKSCHHPRFKEICEKNFTVAPNKACFDPSQMIVFWPALIIHHTCQMDLHQASSLVPDKTLWSQKILKILRFWSLL